MIPPKHFYMIRHGQTEANAGKIMAGSLDSPLTAHGKAEARHAAQIMPHLPIRPVAIIHSNLSRARHTAEILNEHLNLPLHEDPDLAEMHAGDWEGVPYDRCQSMLHDWDDPPGGETYTEFFDRIKRAKIKAFKDFDGPVLIVCHGGVFRAFAKMHGIDSYGVRNCHLYEFEAAPENTEFPWKAWHYEHYDGENPTLQCDCSLEIIKPMTKPSSMSPPETHTHSYKLSENIMRTACDIFHSANVSSSDGADKIAS